MVAKVASRPNSRGLAARGSEQDATAARRAPHSDHRNKLDDPALSASVFTESALRDQCWSIA